MKYFSVLVGLLSCLALAGCDEVEPIENPGTHPFFPYQIGDEYVVEEWGVFSGLEFKDTLSYRVVDVVKFNGKPYFRVIGTGGLMYFPGSEPLPRTPDTILFRVEGSRIFYRNNVGEYVYLDFDAPYAFSLEPTAPMGFVKDTTSVEVKAGQFDGKLMRKAQPISTYFVYSKDVGFVMQFSPEYQALLLSAKISGRVLP